MPLTPAPTATPVAAVSGAAWSASGPGPVTDVVLVDAYAAPTHGPGLFIVDRDGRAVRSTLTSDEVVGTGTHGAYVLDKDGTLSVFSPRGTLTRLAKLAATSMSTSPELAEAAESPDGSEWSAAVVTWTMQAGEPEATTKVYIGSFRGTAPRLVGTYSRAEFAGTSTYNYRGGYVILRWTSRGILLGTDPTGVGGGAPFIEEGYSHDLAVWLNPATGVLSAPVAPTGCLFEDVASDGTVACLSGRTALRVIRPNGSQANLSAAGADAVGEVAWLGGGDGELVYATAVRPSGGPWTDTVHVATVQGGTIRDVRTIAARPFENDHAWDSVLDAGTLIVSSGSYLEAPARVVDLDSGATFVLGTVGVTDMLGVIRAPA